MACGILNQGRGFSQKGAPLSQSWGSEEADAYVTWEINVVIIIIIIIMTSHVGHEIITSSSRSCDESSCIKIIIKIYECYMRTELGEGFIDFGFWRDWGLDCVSLNSWTRQKQCHY